MRSDGASPPPLDPRARSELRGALRDFYRAAPGYETRIADHDAGYFARYRRTWRACVPMVETVLELGAGTAEGLAPLVAEGRIERLVALELAPHNLRLIAARADGIQALAGDALQLPVGSRSVDVVTSFQFIEHVPAVPEALDEALRVLRRPGYLVVGMPNHASLSTPLEDFVRGRTRRAFGVASRAGALRWWLRNVAIAARKRATRAPVYLYRDPDLGAATAGGDRDAVYYGCPLDLMRDLAARGARLMGTDATVRWGALGRLVPAELRGSMIAVWRID